ncbi:MAG: lipoyl synthase [Planctomycetes bacterium]|nr:lipoyl synthase [Planctomycetota bacterium]
MLAVAEKTGNCSLRICDCGLAEYRQVLQQQRQLHDKRRRGEIQDTILITEHPPVITLGARQSANRLQVSRDSLKKQHIDVVDIRRGGGTTAHNPGQLVCYPILHLPELDLGISEYIRELEAIGAELLLQLGVRSQRRKGFPGLWVDNRKIASIGVRAPKLVTYHGVAINIQNDLSIFDFITPCGLNGVEMTSVLKETGKHHPMTQVKKQLSQLLIKHFSTSNEPQNTNFKPRKLPPWLRRPLSADETFERTNNILHSLGLETVCWSTNCPNRGECWARGTATVLILGNICTRDCKFCSVAAGQPEPPDKTEPLRLAEMAEQMGAKYLVITSVDRDDLPDGGAGHFRDCINKVRQRCPNMKFEILTPDFRNCQSGALKILSDALPFVFAHNIETVPSLYPIARAGGDYQRSLNLLKTAKEALRFAQGDSFELVTKSSIMLGLGETDAEVEQVLKDLRNVGCDRITIGQYLKPSKDSLEVAEYVKPEKFDFWKQKAFELGFSWVKSSPFARSSYFAEQEKTS